jgi:hypothetical protein
VKLILVCNTAPDSVLSLLKESGVSLDDVTTLKRGVTLAKRCRERFIFIFNFSDYNLNYRILNLPSFNSKVAFLFCSTLDAVRIVGGVPLDAELKNLRSEYIQPTAETLTNILTLPSNGAITISNRDLIQQYLTRTNDNSVLTPLMTVLYGLKAETRQLVQEIIYSWLFSEKVSKLSAILSRLQEMRDPKVNSNFLRKVIDIFASTGGKNLRRATRRISRIPKTKVTKSDFAKAAKLTGADSYELNYVGNAFYQFNLKGGKKSLSTIYHGKSLTSHSADLQTLPAKVKKHPAAPLPEKVGEFIKKPRKLLNLTKSRK